MAEGALDVLRVVLTCAARDERGVAETARSVAIPGRRRDVCRSLPPHPDTQGLGKVDLPVVVDLRVV